MFARTSERKMLTLRGALLLAWLGLIASLFWDPFSSQLTIPDNLASPFRVDEPTITLQDQEIRVDPYAMGARVFWTMAVPIVPLFLMVFGHETWRRICPLSMASQIPRYLGLRRRKTQLQRRTGKVDEVLALIGRDSWLARNVWFFQFFLLFLGINARILFINSDRTALATALLSIILASVLTGYLWGGKTWCNYFCPVNVVQKIYTEPRGLLESAPHLSRPALPQSMCRTSGPNGDKSACVACTASCGDIDLERSYWDGIANPQRRKVYYMFLGLILGFYGYYYLYSGNWDYYFSGYWTHEDGALGKLLEPGLFIGGQSIPIPKLAAVPLTIGLACLASLALGLTLEAIYRRIRRNRPISEAEIINHCLSVSAWMSINTFYFFGGRPNLMLLPPTALRLIDVGIVALTTMWLWQALQCSPFKYQRESMASNLLGQLKKLKVDVSRYLDGRPLEDLKPDEVYVLTKVLPAFSHEQKLQAYRHILDDAVTTGTTASPSALRLLHDFRSQMDISDAEHLKLLEELGVTDASETDMVQISATEKLACIANYREIIGGSIAERIASGLSMDMILTDNAFRSTVDLLRASLQITESEHQMVVAELFAPGGRLNLAMTDTLNALAEKQSARFCLEAADFSDPLVMSLVDLTIDQLDAQIRTLLSRGLSILRAFDESPAACWYAQDLAALAGGGLDRMLVANVAPDQLVAWHMALPADILRILRGAPARNVVADLPDRPDDIPVRNPRDIVTASFDRQLCFELLVDDADQTLRALGLTVYAYEFPHEARQAAQRLAQDTAEPHWLLRDVLDRLLDVQTGPATEKEPSTEIRAVLNQPGQPEHRLSFHKPSVTIGRALNNDIVIGDPGVWAYHAAIQLGQGEVRLVRMDMAEIAVNGRNIDGESALLPPDGVIRFGPVGASAPTLRITWAENDTPGRLLQVEPVMRLAMLARNPQLHALPIHILIEIAATAQVRRQLAGEKIRATADQDLPFHLVHQGRIRAFDPGDFETAARQMFGPGDLIGPDLTRSDLTGPESPLVLEIASDFATIVQIDGTPEIVGMLGTRLRQRIAPPPEAMIYDLAPVHSH